MVWHAAAKSKIELFDVVADPHETKDLAGENDEQVKQLRARVDGWWAVD